MGILPCLAFAVGEENIVVIESNKTMTANVNDKKINGDTLNISGYDGNSMYVYHANWNQRNGYVGFDLSKAFTDEQLSGELSVTKATLTVNCVEAQTVKQPTVSLVAIDNTKWVDTAYPETSVINVPAYNPTSTLTVIPEGMVVLDEKDITSKGEYEFDVTAYVKDNYVALKDNGISFALINITRTTVSDNTELLKVLFEGKNGTNKPRLTIEFGKDASVDLTLKSGDVTLGSKTVEGLKAGESYVPSDEYAPKVITAGGKIYVRDELTAVTLEAGSNSYIATYTQRAIKSVTAPDGDFSVIAGDTPILPKTLTATLDDDVTTISAAAQWQTTDDITKAGTVTYTALVEGYTGEPVTCIVEVLPCDNAVETFYSSGESNGAQFVWNNKLGYIYGGGNAIFDATFVVNEGSNKLISYGNSATENFDGAAALLRYMSSDVFEYHDGGWKSSSIKCETGKTYRLRTTVDFANKKYQMFITDEDGVTKEVTNGPAAF
ncbi:MAG: Ig-like domain-containing protein, partial [Clostridia bacterium]